MIRLIAGPPGSPGPPGLHLHSTMIRLIVVRGDPDRLSIKGFTFHND